MQSTWLFLRGGAACLQFFVYGITVLVADMAIDVKREMMLSTFGMPFFSLSLSRIILLKLNHEV